MMNFLKKTGIKLSLVAAIIATPSLSLAASGSGFIEGSSESTSAAMENPTFEGQIARINVGINLIRLNTDILERMPVSADAQWVDEVVANITSKMYAKTLRTKAVREDAYYSTVGLTNFILRRPAISVSPLSARLFYEASIIYKNESNGNPDFRIPNMNVFPDITDMKTYVTFNGDSKVEIIDIEAETGFHRNVVEAVISLLPEDLKEEVLESRKEMKSAKKVLADYTSQKGQLDAWLDDDSNAGSPEISKKEEALEIAEASRVEAETEFEAKEDAYLLLLANGAETIEVDYDSSKVELAKKLDKLLDAVDNNAIGAISMFTSATAGMVRGYATISDEMSAITRAQQLTSLVGNQKQFLVERYERMLIGTLMALPNITIGTYMAISQSSEIGKYQDIVNKILEGAKAEEEAIEASK
ncbi:MAG: hypothetical protein U9P72_08405 [Campylobacterota bacterium]|nr:hypothetical protein [Campylobacterota bacterium]